MERMPEKEKEAREIDREAQIANYFDNIMLLLGLNNRKEAGLSETPRRVARMLLDFHQDVDPVVLLKSFDHEQAKAGHPMVVIQDIPLAALCEHHFCPFFGFAHIGYVPGKKVIGLSKFARLVHAIGHRRATIQERLTEEIANAIDIAVDPKGVIVVTTAEHTCATVRGIQVPGMRTKASAIRGAFVHVPAAREEFFSVLGVR